jgi:hypothetical protein
MFMFFPLLFVSCSDDADMEEYTPKAIAFDVFMDRSEEVTRSVIYEDYSELINHPAGGNFWMKAYLRESSALYIDSRVWYNADYAAENPDGNHWQFLEGDDQTGQIYNVYWPKDKVLDFFAYMPYNYEDYNKKDQNGEYTYKVTPGYDEQNHGVVIGYKMPKVFVEDDDHQEQEAAGLHDRLEVSSAHALGRAAVSLLVRQGQADGKGNQHRPQKEPAPTAHRLLQCVFVFQNVIPF